MTRSLQKVLLVSLLAVFITTVAAENLL